MKKSYKYLGLAFCVLSVALAGNALATPLEKPFENLEGLADQCTDGKGWDKDCHLFYVIKDFSLREASMDAGEPIDTFHLFITDADGKLIKNAQVITTIVDQRGNQLANRALPFKGGYLIAIDHLASGQYRVEAEIATEGQLLTDMFQFNKA